MVSLASEPDGFEHTEIVETAALSRERLGVDAGPLQADEHSLRVQLGGRRLEAQFADPHGWERPFGPLGPAQLLPWLGQYWAPHLLGARVTGSYGDRSLDGTQVYAEKNWGAAFADHWWWGQGPGVAFAGGRIHGVAPTAVVAWTDRGTIALAPPLARTVARAGRGEWHIRASSARWRIEIEGEAPDGGGLRLPVPLPKERRLELRSNHHLTGQLEARVWRGRRLWLRTSGLAALEDGSVSRGGS
jgi:tocopherol cyclase